MANYSTDFDFGGAAESGPWLRWHARPTNDGAHQGGTWSVHEGGDSTAIDLATGLCLDWPNYKTGWIQSNGAAGVAPQKQWNRDRARSEKKPGDGWSRAFWVPVAFRFENRLLRAVWESNQAGAYVGFSEAMQTLKPELASQRPQLPLLEFTGCKNVRFGAGSTVVPQFRVKSWIARPACLPEEVEDAAQASAPDDAWGTSQRTPAVASGAGKVFAGLHSDLDDEVPF